jgi:hypothetical protein
MWLKIFSLIALSFIMPPSARPQWAAEVTRKGNKR